MGRNTNAVERVRRSAACVALALPCLLSGCADDGAAVESNKAARESFIKNEEAGKNAVTIKGGRGGRGAVQGKSFKGRALKSAE